MKNEGTRRMLNYYLDGGMWYRPKVEQEIKSLPEGKAKNNYWRVLLNHYLEIDLLDDAQEIANKRLKRELTFDEIENSLMGRLLSEGWMDGTQEIANKFLKRELTVDETENSLIGCLKSGPLSLDDARKITKERLKKDLTVNELEVLLEPYLKIRQLSKNSIKMKNLNIINRIIARLPEKNKRKHLKTLMDIYLTVKLVLKAEKVAERLNKLDKKGKR